MPLYAISTRNAFPLETRAQVAKMITEVHCRHTGAPESFVNVMFWTQVPLKTTSDLHILGSVRGGRSDTVNSRVERDIVTRIAELTKTSLARVDFALFEIPANLIMEGYEILPEPGEEASWLARKGGTQTHRSTEGHRR